MKFLKKDFILHSHDWKWIDLILSLWSETHSSVKKKFKQAINQDKIWEKAELISHLYCIFILSRIGWIWMENTLINRAHQWCSARFCSAFGLFQMQLCSWSRWLARSSMLWLMFWSISYWVVQMVHKFPFEEVILETILKQEEKIYKKKKALQILVATRVFVPTWDLRVHLGLQT